MSKRASIGQSNTLFNYFQSPTSNKKVKSSNDSPLTEINISNNTRDGPNKGSDSEEETIKMRPKKRARILSNGSDSDGSKDCVNSTTPKRKSKKKKVKSDLDSSEEINTSKLESFKFSKSTPGEKSFTVDATPKTNGNSHNSHESGTSDSTSNWLHNRLDFIKPDKIRDINKNKPSHPEYDERTLYVPEEFLNKQTPAMRQWWILKSKHMDSVLFFKVGKFYELYHMDAVIGVNHLGFSYMKGDFAHSGFPETAYGKMASGLLEQGFKVARVEQTETPEMVAERCRLKKSGKFDKVVSREICQISTKATCIYGAQMTNAKQPQSYFMLAIAEKVVNGVARFGVCFIDTSIAMVYISEFQDDKYCSRLLALLSQYATELILLERGRISKDTLELLKNTTAGVRRDMLTPKSQFYSAAGTLEKLQHGCYFQNKTEGVELPEIFQELTSAGAVKPEYELALKALGACLWYLKDSELDIQVFSCAKFEMYYPIDACEKRAVKRDYMVLDSMAMENLKLLGGVGTLQKILDHCVTAFGKRLLQHWICRPLYDVKTIKQRQEAVKELFDNTDLLQETRAILKKLPDLERQIAKIHAFGNKYCAQVHPDSRATFYEAKTYSKRKILDLLSTIQAFEKVQELRELFKDCQSRMLRKLTQHEPDGIFIDLTKILHYFKEAFDHENAAKEGKIIPQQGVDEDYDETVQKIAAINEKLDAYLLEQQQFFGCKVTYFGSDKKRFQLDIPEHRTHKVTSEYHLEGTKKGSKRYSTSTTKDLLSSMIQAEKELAKIVQDLNRRIFEKFGDRREEWTQVTHCLMTLDVLCSLAEYARSYSEDICLPDVLPPCPNPVIQIEDGCHPCITNIESFVPNHTDLGTADHPSIMLLSGPNMGGKSTLMRQVSLILIMAQIGSFVPATSCKLNLVDRIFTRLGAHDDILKRQSTFIVELLEASSILQHATVNSFVLLDELGRGTSTHDGNAIATAYVKKLTELKPRTMFSTHYHNLVEHFSNHENIQLAHMACMVENEDGKDVTQENVTFLYKVAQGPCPKSYGFNAAKLAGLPQHIILQAHKIAVQMETLNRNREMIRAIFRNDTQHASKLISSL